PGLRTRTPPRSRGTTAPGRARGRRGASPDRWTGAERLRWWPPLRRLDFDPPRLGLLGLGHADRQDAVVQVCLDVLGVGVSGERDAVFELARLARPPAEDSLTLLLLDLAGDDHLGVAHLDIDVLAIHAWKFRFDDPG